jgi:KDO2-lipid IV(A) lauroyltransferase
MSASQKAANALSAATICLVGLGSRLLPTRASHRFGSLMGRVAYYVLRYRRRVAIQNIRSAFSGQLTEGEAVAVAKATFANVGKSALEFLNLPRMSGHDILGLVHFEGEDNLKKALAKGRGVIYLTAHFGNWELMGAALCSLGYKLTVIARKQRDPTANRVFDAVRRAAGMGVLDDKRAVPRALRILRRNEVLGILADQNTESGAVFVPFFGRPAATAGGAAVLAMRTGAAVIPGFIVRNADDSHTVRIEPEIPIGQTGDSERDVASNTAKFAAHLEGWIRAYPDHWLWLHKRWKAQPPGGAGGGDSLPLR